MSKHAKIKLRDPDGSGEMIDTTVGRVVFNEIVPDGVPFVNKVLTKKNMRPVISEILSTSGFKETADFLDNMKHLGFEESTVSGITFSLSDIVVPGKKEDLIEEADQEVDKARGNYQMGFITDNERYNQVIDIWTQTNNRVSEVLFESLKEHREGLQPDLYDG